MQIDTLHTDHSTANKGMVGEPSYISSSYTPTHASWLNQIELWFSILGRKLLNHIEARSVDELVGKIMGFINYYNETAHPFVWTYKGKVLNI